MIEAKMSPPLIFNRTRYALHQKRAAAKPELFLLEALAERIHERLAEIRRSFQAILELNEYPALQGQNVTHATFSPDENLAMEQAQYDAVVCPSGLQWVNDLPGMMVQIQRILKPDGLFLAIVPGGETLKELRHSFEATETQLRGGISPRVSPFVDVRDAGSLLQRAGFALPVVDSEMLELHYESPLKLMYDLRRMGQANSLQLATKHFTSRSLIQKMMEYYIAHYPAPNGRVTASFELVTLVGWKPHDSQPKPAIRGSGQVNLGEILH